MAIDILQFFPKFSTISPGLVILPLIAILALTAAKDGYEDVKRHQSDARVNHSEVEVLDGEGYVNPNLVGAKSKTFTPGIPKVLKRKKKGGEGEGDLERDAGEPAADGQAEYSAAEEKERMSGQPMDHQHAMRVNLPPTQGSGASTPRPTIERHISGRSNHHPLDDVDTDPSEPHWQRTLWEDLRVGDFVRLRSDESIPADIVLCATSEPENVAFVETKNLDGETNLKSRNAVLELTHLASAYSIVNGNNEVGPKGPARFRIDAEAPDVNMYKFNAAVVLPGTNGREDTIHPIDIQTTLLRGTILRNTEWAIGIVLYTGGDTKIVMNSGITPSKRSRVERQMNPMV